MKKLIALFLSALTAALLLCSCQQTDEKIQDKLIVYCTESEKEGYVQTFKTYNSFCAGSGLGLSYQVDFKTFDDIGELNKKMTTEIMAGGGPDLFLTNQTLPFEKMIESEMFCDIDALCKEEGESLNLDDCNKKILDAGVYSGKRFIVPLLYTPNASLARKEALKSIGVSPKQNCSVSYNDKKVMDNLIKYRESTSLDYLGYGAEFMERFICDYVDFEKKETYFDTDEFGNNLELIKKLCSDKQNEDEAFVPILSSPLYTIYDAADSFVETRIVSKENNITRTVYNKEDADNTVVCRGIQRDKSANLGTIEVGVGINKNSTQKKKALAFVKYALSEHGQSHFTNPRNYVLSAMPVNNKVFEKRLQNASEIEAGGKAVGLKSEVIKTAIKVSESVEKCTLNRGYYTQNIAGRLVENYLENKLSRNKFIRQLTTATKFYLEE